MRTGCCDMRAERDQLVADRKNARPAGGRAGLDRDQHAGGRIPEPCDQRRERSLRQFVEQIAQHHQIVPADPSSPRSTILRLPSDAFERKQRQQPLAPMPDRGARLDQFGLSHARPAIARSEQGRAGTCADIENASRVRNPDAIARPLQSSRGSRHRSRACAPRDRRVPQGRRQDAARRRGFRCDSAASAGPRPSGDRRAARHRAPPPPPREELPEAPCGSRPVRPAGSAIRRRRSRQRQCFLRDGDADSELRE